ncbi:MAG: polyprenol monophosphomannose synthase [archaeon]|nr:polyprenol monophosphomannose synthase [archaeon]
MESESTQHDPRYDRPRKLCLIIPTYNEKENIAKLISRIEALRDKLPLELSLIVVDDGSADGTLEVVRQIMEKSDNLRLIKRPNLLGIGSAYLDGFAFGLAADRSDYFGEMDADLQHPPEVLIEMSKAANEGADVVVASRYVKGGGSVGWSFTRRMVSRSANYLAKICVRAPVSDLTSGFRIMSKKAISGLLQTKLSTRGYAFQIESLYVYKKMNMTFSEVPYFFEERKSGETKLHWIEMARFAGTAIKLGLFGLNVRKG